MNDIYISKGYSEYFEKTLMLLFILAFSFYVNGSKALITVLICIASYLTSKIIFSVLLEKKRTNDFSFLFIPLSLSLMLPANFPVYAIIITSVFTACVAELPFGNTVTAPFASPCVGIAFSNICFKNEITSYPVSTRGDFFSNKSLAFLLKNGSCFNINSENFWDIMTGNIAGAMGSTCILLLISCIIFVFMRKKQLLLPLVGYFIIIAIFILIFPRTQASFFNEFINEICSGTVLFCSIFFLCDNIISPKNSLKKVIYGFIAGITLMVMKHIGSFEDPTSFSIIITNALSGVLEKNE